MVGDLTVTEGEPGSVATKTDPTNEPLYNVCFSVREDVRRQEVDEI